MNADEAADAIAKYLAGGPADRQQLAKACEAVNADEECRQFFCDEFGLAGPPETTCEKFDAHVAELAEMTSAQREREMAELVRHAEQCARCRQTYWDVREPWISQAVAVATARGRQVVRTLAEGIRLAIGRAGEIIECGLSPPSVLCPVVAGMNRGRLMGEAAAGPPGPESEERAWTLEDEVPAEGGEGSETRQVKITVRVRIAAKGKALLSCLVEGLPEGELAGMHLVVSGRKLPRTKDGKGVPYHFQARLADYLDKAVEVPAGEHVIRIQWEGSRLSRAWEIPLSLGPGGT
jgi:hypothetical protein